MSAPKVVFGAAVIGNYDPYKTASDLQPLLKTLKSHNVNTLDSAQYYGASEATIGTLSSDVKDSLVIDTKWIGGWSPGFSNKQNIIDTGKKSMETLAVKQVDIFYLHANDPESDLAETCAGVNEVYKTGAFKRFGLSNFLPKTVKEVYDICEKNGYVLPSVYQVNYSAVTRKPEEELFPLLRKLNIAIYAYSPIAGGFLAKTRQQIEAGDGRFNDVAIGGMYKRMYNKPEYLDLLDKWAHVAEEVGCSRAELAYRWVEYHSALSAEKGDACIVGASSVEQLEKTLKGIENGPLPEKAAKQIGDMYESVKHIAPVDNYHG